MRRLILTSMIKLTCLSLVLGSGVGSALAAAENEPYRRPFPHWKELTTEAYSGSPQGRQEKLVDALNEAKTLAQIDGYPQSECLFELGALAVEQNKLEAAQKNFEEAKALKEKALGILWTRECFDKGEKLGYLPAYSNPEQELHGKRHDLANCLGWLGDVYLKESHTAEAATTYSQSIKVMEANGPETEAIIFPEVLLKYARTLRLLGRANEARQVEERAKQFLAKRQLLDK